ncbi:hypothetical protein INS49_004613 [Diaporthe citri]|uniref:uncharacterized protein n=1 Tax=Diaporthe citri TaxID=83186 RepID=UPI001C7FE092|nr:uncharacterized protein INS49_004613 [Diaporthe citri]KAG6354595.1 hypothetical protein INS49_004613 [Diaporthe citri]
MFSRPAKDAFDAARKLYKRSRRIARAKSLDQPIGASIPETSAGSDLDILAVDATIHQSISQGLNGATIDGHLRMVCNYANEWHQRMDPSRNYTGVGAPDGPLKGGRPLFYVADVDNDGVPYANPSAEQFWMMRYIFVPVYMPPKRPDGPNHVSLLVICPVTKTLEFLDSDNKPADDDYTHGLVGRIMQWMSKFLDNPRDLDAPQFVPEEWKFRDSRSKQQEQGTTDCGLFVLTQAQYMAFGYDYSQSEEQQWPSNAGDSLLFNYRRFRITTDITGEGVPAPFFTFFNPEFRLNQIQNHQYYPILDTPPVLEDMLCGLPLQNLVDQALSTQPEILPQLFRRLRLRPFFTVFQTVGRAYGPEPTQWNIQPQAI